MARKQIEERILDVDASMQGTIRFRDPVNLRINGSFEGKLDTRGSLTIGENAKVQADITGDKVIIAGKITGNLTIATSLSVIAPAVIKGNIQTPALSVTEGAVIEGRLNMVNLKGGQSDSSMNLRDVAQYVEVEAKVIEEWARKKRIPAQYENGEWRFNKIAVDQWIQDEKVKS